MIFIRADANEQIATGHIMRSKTIAYRLQELGRKVTFLVSDEDSIELIKGEFQYIILHTKWDDLCSEEELGKVKEILIDSAQKENEVPVLFVDSYFVDNRYFKCLNQFAKTVMVDDLGEDTYDADIVINYNITYEDYGYEERYKNKNTRLILGAEYVPLRPQFAELAEELAQSRNAKLRILLMCGGGDRENALCAILDDWKARGGFADKEIWVVAGRYNPNLAQLKKIASDCSNVKLWCDVCDVASLMRQCDVAVTAASTVLYECCAVSLPAVAFAVADNQMPDLKAFNKKCGMSCTGDMRNNQQETLRNIYESIDKLCSDKHLRENLGEKMHRLVDGKGAQRLANAIDRIFETGSFYERTQTEEKYTMGGYKNKPHKFNLCCVNEGRTAIGEVLKAIGTDCGKKVCILPQYTCETVIIPFLRKGWEVHYFEVNERLQPDPDSLDKCFKEYKPNVLLWHTYYGVDTLKEAYTQINSYKKIESLAVIEDVTQSLFLSDKAYNRADYIVGSLRKWLEIAEGGFFASRTHCLPNSSEYDRRCFETYVVKKREAQRMKQDYLNGEFVEKELFLKKNREAEELLDKNEEVYGISEQTMDYIQRTDFEMIRERRNRNAEILWNGLKDCTDKIKPVFDGYEWDAPLYFPIYAKFRQEIQAELQKHDIYAPVLWPVADCLKGKLGDKAEYIYENLLALPCDQRYRELDMHRINRILQMTEGGIYSYEKI